ncbi:MAG: hypothetical protein N2561_05535 [Bacteroidetes bacterium]|nr:hypothetical protein [Rhodothermia bacterium]MCS7154858.1 hypothetical protein [Bacteroidota bacterium]MCX7906984.1 hypothetical protein [Bacteroidota bacterium]MDW8137652.1 hypothetical protein [Bacteroidota bacterium]MDW8285394.1 hypothetical protein [Bacteroidota bacterium]
MRVQSGLLGLLLLMGCGLFQTRTPEAPATAEANRYRPPETPDIALANLEAAIATLNVQDYVRGLSSGFRYSPATPALARNPALWAGWGVEQESAYFQNLRLSAQGQTGHRISLSERQAEAGSERYQITARYVLQVQHRRPDVPTVAEGRMSLTLVRERDGLWRILEWTDAALENRFSWSDLRAAFLR